MVHGPESAKRRGMQSATASLIGLAGIGLVVALVAFAVSPPSGEVTRSPISLEKVVPNTPPPVRTE